VASGVNNYNSEYEPGEGSGAPAIFMLALNKPSDAPWVLGTNYFKISFPLDSTLAENMAPGVIDFSTLWDKDGAVTHIYSGDLHGNLWKLDFTDAATTSKYKPKTSWNMTQLSSFKKGSPSAAYPFYRAQRTAANVTKRQPISAAPLLVQGPIVQGLETFYVAFGTGKYLETADVANADKQSFYVIFDNGTITADSTSTNRQSIITPGTSRLQAATVNTTNQTISVPAFVWGRPKTDTEALTQKSGWYFDFPDNGERMIYAANDLGQFDITFNSVVPGVNQITPSVCSADEATSNVFDINIRTGGGRYRTSQIGILGPSLFLENEEKTQTSAVDSTGRAQRTIVREEIASGTAGHAVRSTSSTEVVGRLSWRQLYNYKELKHSSTPATVTPPASNPTTSEP
jgi:type IV pilus assembly protein PilY1